MANDWTEEDRKAKGIGLASSTTIALIVGVLY